MIMTNTPHQTGLYQAHFTRARFTRAHFTKGPFTKAHFNTVNLTTSLPHQGPPHHGPLYYGPTSTRSSSPRSSPWARFTTCPLHHGPTITMENTEIIPALPSHHYTPRNRESHGVPRQNPSEHDRITIVTTNQLPRHLNISPPRFSLCVL